MKMKNTAMEVPANRIAIGLHQWCVFAGCYIITVIDVGLFLAQGPLFVIIMNKFGSNRTETALVFSVSSSVSLGTGIIVGPLLHRFGERRVVLCGAILSSSALVGSAFVPSLNVLIVTYVCMGLGICPAFLGSISAAGKCFPTKYRGVMLAILSTGSGVGGVFYPQLFQYLDNLYGYPGVFLILSGAVLQTAVAAMVWYPEKSIQRQKGNQSKENEAPGTDKKKCLNGEIFTIDNPTFESEHVNGKTDIRENTSLYFDNAVFEDDADSNIEIERTDGDAKHNDHHSEKDSSGNPEANNFQFGKRSVLFVSDICGSTERTNEKQNKTDDHDDVSLEYSKESLPVGISSNLKQVELSNGYNQKEESSPTVLESFKFLCKQKMFWAITIGLSLVIPVINLYPIFIIDVFKDSGLTEIQSSLGLSLMNGFGILGRVSSGIILKIPRMFATGVPFVGASFVVFGITGVAFVQSLYPLFAFCAVYGIGQGIFVASISVTTAELFGIKHLSNAVGIMFTSSSLGGIAVGPVIGFIRDQTESYTSGLFVGVGLCTVGMILFLLAEIWRRQNTPKIRQRAKSIHVSAL